MSFWFRNGMANTPSPYLAPRPPIVCGRETLTFLSKGELHEVLHAPWYRELMTLIGSTR